MEYIACKWYNNNIRYSEGEN